MRIYRFDVAVAQPITQYASHGASIAPVTRHEGSLQAGCIHIEPGGILGDHPAIERQLFMVVAGNGQVRGEEGAWTATEPGEAAFWEEGEHHESRSDTGMTAIVLEGNGLDPSRFIPEAG